MSTYLDGCDVLGAMSTTTFIERRPIADDVIGADVVQAVKEMPATQFMSQQQIDKDAKKQKENRNKTANAGLALIISGIAGTLIGGAVGGLLWKSHRVAGILIGSLIAGPAVGFGVGSIIAIEMEK